MKYFNVGYKSANYYLIDAGPRCLAVDGGWPGTLNDYGRQLRPTGKRVQDIDYLMVTHFHPDHAGLIQELKTKGAKFLGFDIQIPFIAPMEAMIERTMKYGRIQPEGNLVLSIRESRDFLAKLGLEGQVVHTPGHTDDSVSLLLDSGDAFIGDLQPESRIMESDEKSLDSWALLRRLGAKRVHPGHGPPFEL